MHATARQTWTLVALAAAMALTRINHFAPLPDASWAVFFVAGFTLRPLLRWAFPLLMALAVTIDWLVIRGQGLQFWQHYCVSPGYVALVPAYLVLSLGGAWLRGQAGGPARTVLLGVPALVLAVAACHLLSQGAFYWSSANVPQPTLAGWARNYLDWFPLYLRSAALYVAAAAALGWALQRLERDRAPALPR